MIKGRGDKVESDQFHLHILDTFNVDHFAIFEKLLPENQKFATDP